MVSKNKKLILGALIALGIFGSVHWMVVKANWDEADALLKQADENRSRWDKFFKAGDKLVPRPEADKAINESNEKLRTQFDELKKIEFGTADSLHVFSVAAAGQGDPKNYLASSITQMRTKAKDTYNIGVPIELGIGEKAAEEPVPLNLFRLAMIDRFLVACRECSVPTVTRIRYDTATRIESPFDKPAEEETAAPKKGGKEKEEEKPAPKDVEALIQFPMRVVILAPERSFAQLLFRLQEPSDAQHGYFGIRGFHVWVRDAGSGMIEASLALNAVLNEKLVAKLGIPFKVPDEHRSPLNREMDLNRGY
jgi:hypothetical protein